MEEVVLFKARFGKVLEKHGVGSDLLAEELVEVVRDLAQSILDEEDEGADENDFSKAFNAGWDNAMQCVLGYCGVEEEYTDY